MPIPISIHQVELFHISLPMKFSFKTGFGEIFERQSLIIKVIDNQGTTGWGESAALTQPIYLEESVTSCKYILKDILIPLLLSKNWQTVEEFVQATQWIRGNNLAKYGLETALFDYCANLNKENLKKTLGIKKDYIELGESIGLQDKIKDLLDIIQKRLLEGYKRIKIKVKPGKEVKQLKAIRQEFPDIDLMVDANSSYTLKDIELLKSLDQFNLMMIEQPLGYSDLVDHAILQAKLNTPICLDESITSYHRAYEAITLQSCQIINIKPGRIGSLIETQKIHALAQKNSIGVWCGGMLETVVGKYFNAIISGLPGYIYPADISPSNRFFYEDIGDDLEFENGKVSIPNKFTLDKSINLKVLQQNTVSKITINKD